MDSRTLFLLLVFGNAVLGCSRQTPPELFTVKGKVTYRGRPVSNVMVIYSPSAEEGSPVAGLTDRDGEYVLRQKDGRIGAHAGAYRILIRQLSPSRNAKAIPVEWTRYSTDSTPLQARIPGDTFDIAL